MERKIAVASSSPSSSSSDSLSLMILTQDEVKKITAYKVVEYMGSNMVLAI